MPSGDKYIAANRLDLNNHLYEVGATVPFEAFEETNPTTGLLHIHPQTPEQLIQELRDAGVLKLPVELEQASALQAQLEALHAQLAEKAGELANLQQQMAAAAASQPATLPATAPTKRGPSSRNPESAPAAESAPLSDGIAE